MSGWGGYSWATLAFAGLAITVGTLMLIQSFQPLEPARSPIWLQEARAAHGGGHIEPAPAPSLRGLRISGLIFIGLGLLRFVIPDRTSFGGIGLIVMGSLFLAFFGWQMIGDLLGGRDRERPHERRRRRKLEARLARGTDAYAGELDKLLAEDPPVPRQPPALKLACNILLPLCAIGLLAAGLATPR